MTEDSRGHPAISTLSEQMYGRRLLSKLKGTRFPYTGQWELTYRCNLKCVMCYTDPFNTPEMIKRELRYGEILRIMDELVEAGCFELCFTGGEPFTRSDFLDIYTSAKCKGFLVTIFSNGTLITPSIADHLTRYPPAMIEISFHGLTKESFEQITHGQGSYERCLAGIGLILERGLPLTLKTVGMTANRDEILGIKRYVERLSGSRSNQVHYKFGSEVRSRLDGSEDVFGYQLPRRDVTAIEQADPVFRADRARQARQAEAARQNGLQRCGGGQYKFHIDAYGQLQRCSGNRRQGYDLRHGSFRTGFYEALPDFPCPNRTGEPLIQLSNSVRSAV